jgi:hypothetical protein
MGFVILPPVNALAIRNLQALRATRKLVTTHATTMENAPTAHVNAHLDGPVKCADNQRARTIALEMENASAMTMMRGSTANAEKDSKVTIAVKM